MSIKGFLRGVRAVASKPEYLKNMTPEQLAERRRRIANQNMFAIQMFEPPEPHRYKAPKRQRDRDSASE
jgi:hypothetical protein